MSELHNLSAKHAAEDAESQLTLPQVTTGSSSSQLGGALAGKSYQAIGSEIDLGETLIVCRPIKSALIGRSGHREAAPANTQFSGQRNQAHNYSFKKRQWIAAQVLLLRAHRVGAN
jgi:hypothetical protein